MLFRSDCAQQYQNQQKLLKKFHVPPSFPMILSSSGPTRFITKNKPGQEKWHGGNLVFDPEIHSIFMLKAPACACPRFVIETFTSRGPGTSYPCLPSQRSFLKARLVLCCQNILNSTSCQICTLVPILPGDSEKKLFPEHSRNAHTLLIQTKPIKYTKIISAAQLLRFKATGKDDFFDIEPQKTNIFFIT